MMVERKKFNQIKNPYVASYFWRMQRSGEIDLIEEYDGALFPYEFKWNKDKTKRSA
jgi:hypothetical protein